MENKEKILYHQIHPLKLATDWGTSIIGLYFLWQHEFILALVIILIPPVIATFLIIRFADLNKYKKSSFGKYISKYMTRKIELVRFIGIAIAAFGAWHHQPYGILFGFIVILLAWFRGKLLP